MGAGVGFKEAPAGCLWELLWGLRLEECSEFQPLLKPPPGQGPSQLWSLPKGISHALLAGKAKIYQGVRVKMTVKELLQQRRAKQAPVAEAVFGECSRNVQAGEVFSPLCTVPYIDTAPESSLSSCLQQPWQFQSGTSCEEIPNYLEQLVDSCLQAEPALEMPLTLAQDNLPCSPESFQPALTCLGSGSPEAVDPPSSFDYSYAPSQMPPCAPLGYSCPTLDGRSCMYPSPEERTCQPHNHIPHTSGLSTCYCTRVVPSTWTHFEPPNTFPTPPWTAKTLPLRSRWRTTSGRIGVGICVTLYNKELLKSISGIGTVSVGAGKALLHSASFASQKPKGIVQKRTKMPQGKL
ncbi:hypothetical protein E2320_007197 [Naja naja]|nr:hypothetical protein E2320_007197 [Naja naja]